MSFLCQHKQAIQNKFTKFLVSGYIHKQESYNNLQATPTLIIYIIQIFYHINEHFTSSADNCCLISNDGQTIINTQMFEHSSKSDSNIYLNEWIDSLSKRIITWTFTIDKLKNGMSFGLVSNRKLATLQKVSMALHRLVYLQQLQQNRALLTSLQNNPQFWQQSKFPDVLSYIFTHAQYCDFSDISSKQISNLKCKEGDTVCITLDLQRRKVRCIINYDKEIILLQNIEIEENMKWRMVMRLDHIGDSVSIVNCYEHA